MGRHTPKSKRAAHPETDAPHLFCIAHAPANCAGSRRASAVSLGHFSGKRQQTAQSFHAYKAPNALQGIGQDLRGDGVAALPHLGPEDLQVFLLRIRVLPSVEGSLLPVDISVERVSLRIPVVGVLAAGLVDEGVDLATAPLSVTVYSSLPAASRIW